jgi:hypothetical protein
MHLSHLNPGHRSLVFVPYLIDPQEFFSQLHEFFCIWLSNQYNSHSSFTFKLFENLEDVIEWTLDESVPTKAVSIEERQKMLSLKSEKHEKQLSPKLHYLIQHRILWRQTFTEKMKKLDAVEDTKVPTKETKDDVHLRTLRHIYHQVKLWNERHSGQVSQVISRTAPTALTSSLSPVSHPKPAPPPSFPSAAVAAPVTPVPDARSASSLSLPPPPASTNTTSTFAPQPQPSASARPLPPTSASLVPTAPPMSAARPSIPNKNKKTLSLEELQKIISSFA